VDMVRVEAACLALAREAGLAVPDFRVAELGRHAALLVARFDCAGGQGRRHMLSMQTLLGADDWYQLGYADLADALRRVSARPEEDLPALYRQALFNALIGNTDDHLKNFTLLHRPEGWRLSPAYDLTPDEPERGEHVLAFGSCGYRPNAAGLAELGRAFGLSRPAVRRIRDEVGAAVGGWRERFVAQGGGEGDVARLAPRIDGRL
jgi:serine/threonine-protein kinase HipA